MSETSIIDHAGLGLESHYNADQCQRIRRLTLEDWQKAGVKLPTYMKLVARYIEDQPIPEVWLSKLSHQTMGKMLKGISTPRYEFWACLHLYLSKKYGALPIGRAAPTDIELIGQALARFGGVTEATDLHEALALKGDNSASVTLRMEGKEPFLRVELVRRHQGDEPFADAVSVPAHGAGIIRNRKLTAIVRSVADRTIESIDVTMPDHGS